MRSSRVHQTAEIVRDLGDAWSFLVRLISIVRTAANRAEHGDCAVHNHGDLNPTAQNYCGRTPRSRSDRTAIAARSNRDRKVDTGGIATSRSEGDRRKAKTTIVARSPRDRGPIVARSWPNGRLFRSKIEEKIQANSARI